MPERREKTGGRKAGTPNKATADVRAAAQQHTTAAVTELARLALNADSEQARVAAIKELLDRGHGKATQHVAGDVPGVLTIRWADCG